MHTFPFKCELKVLWLVGKQQGTPQKLCISYNCLSPIPLLLPFFQAPYYVRKLVYLYVHKILVFKILIPVFCLYKNAAWQMHLLFLLYNKIVTKL